MKFCTNLISLLWCLTQTYLSDSIAANDTDLNKLVYIEKDDIKIPFEVILLYSLKLDNVQQLLFVGDNSICWLNSANYPSCKTSALNSLLMLPFQVFMAPEGAFSFPAITISHSKGISALNISDISNITMYHIVNKNSFSLTPAWINNKEFLVCSSHISAHTGEQEEVLMHYKSVENMETEEWKGTVIIFGVYAGTPITLQNVWESFDAVYTLINKHLYVLWTEDEVGKPGDWQRKEHLKNHSINIGDDPRLQLFDVKKDGKMVLHAIGLRVWTYEIPSSTDFKNIQKYNNSVVDWEFEVGCKNQGIFFDPYISICFVPPTSLLFTKKRWPQRAIYKGKPWILAGGCKTNFYLKPDESEGFDVEKWNYSRSDLKSKQNRSFINTIAAADIDHDGYTDLFLVHRSNLKVFYLKDPTATTPSTPATSSSMLSLNCMIFILVCFTGSFHQMVDMIYA